MRIGLDVRVLGNPGGSATRGIGRYVTDLVDGLLAHAPGESLVLFAREGQALPEGWTVRAEIVSVGGPTFADMPRPFYMKLPKLRGSPTLLGRLHERAVEGQRRGFEAAVDRASLDVLHLPTAVDVGSYPEGDFQIPVVATFLDAIPLVHRDAYYDAWPPYVRRFYDRQLAALSRTARVVAISESSRRHAIEYAGLAPERVDVVYPSVAPAFFAPPDSASVAAVRARHGISGPFVLFCSVPDPHKNAEGVVAAFARARLEGTRLVFVSPREEPYLGRLRNAARNHGLADESLVVTGRVSDSDLIALFGGAVCLASPSLVEGFGLPAAQAMAAGTPSIVSRRGSQPEVVGDAGIVVDPEDVGAIAEAMARLATDPDFREERVRRGRERARLFAPERQARELLAVYGAVSRNV